MPGGPAAAPALGAGFAALERGEWGDARRSFEAALVEAETPAAFEGLGAAAWWLDDAETLFAARERAYRLYRETGDAQGAGRVASALAVDYLLLRAEEAVASGWIQRAHRLLDDLDLCAEQGMLAANEGTMAIELTNDTAAARTHAEHVIEVGRSLGVADLEMLGLAIRGLALVSEGAVNEGMRLLDEATAAAVGGDMEEPLAIGMTCCNLMFACERVRDFDRAAQWCARIEAFSARVGLRLVLSLCRVHYAWIALVRGDWDEAEGELLPLLEDLAASLPALVPDALAHLGELRRRQGRLDEAEELLRPVAFHPVASIGLAAVALDRGDGVRAADLAERTLRAIPEGARTERVSACELLVRARATLGDVDGARAALAELRDTAGAIGTPLLDAAAKAAEGAVDAAAGQHDEARRLFEDALARYVGSEAPYDAAASGLELARTLAALGRVDAASREAAAARETFERLGAEAAGHRVTMFLDDLAAGTLAVPRPDGPAVTDRELEVLRLVADGLSDGEIAERLVLSEHTVHRHVANIRTRLGVSSRSAAVARAARLGLL